MGHYELLFADQPNTQAVRKLMIRGGIPHIHDIPAFPLRASHDHIMLPLHHRTAAYTPASTTGVMPCAVRMPLSGLERAMAGSRSHINQGTLPRDEAGPPGWIISWTDKGGPVHRTRSVQACCR